MELRKFYITIASVTALLLAGCTGAPTATVSHPISTPTPWESVVQHASTGTSTFLLIGDSIGVGNGATPDINSGWARLFYKDLAAFSGGGSGVFCLSGPDGEAGCDINQTGTWTGVPGAIYQQVPSTIYSIFSATAPATACIPSWAMGGIDTVTLYYYTNQDSAAFSVTVDGTSAGTFGAAPTSSLLPAPPVTLSISPSLSGHNVCVNAPASGKVYLFGANLTLGTTGMRQWNISIAGANSGAYAYDTSWMSFLPSNTAAIIALGQNDGGFIGPTLISNLNLISSKLTALKIPTADLITGPFMGSTPTNQAGVDAVAAWALAYPMPEINIWDRWGSFAAGNAKGFYADAVVHPADPGYLDMKVAVEQLLLPDINLNQ